MRISVLCICCTLVLCGCAGNESAPPVAATAPQFVRQPSSQTVPLASTATFSAVAIGTPTPSYQWQLGGVNIHGAIGSTYTIQSTSLQDSGLVYDVVISNTAGSITSQPATLTIGARSPAVGDLRFQQVDASTTYNGYIGSNSSILSGGSGVLQTGAFGLPLSIGPSCVQNLGPNGLFGCAWFYNSLVPLSPGTTTLSVGYQSYQYSDLATAFAGLAQPSIVITGMDLEPSSGAVAFSWNQQASGSAFDVSMETADASTLSAMVNADCARGRVVTAISYSGTQIAYLSYGWQGNGSTVYDCEVETTTTADGAVVATQMAQDGYIITAGGGNEYSGVLLVGTRVHGDSLPRAIMIAPGGTSPVTLAYDGYATVVVLFAADGGAVDWIGER